MKRTVKGVSGKLKIEHQKGKLVILVLTDDREETLEAQDADVYETARDIKLGFSSQGDRPVVVTDSKVIYYISKSDNDWVMYGNDPIDDILPINITGRFNEKQAAKIIALMEQIMEAES